MGTPLDEGTEQYEDRTGVIRAAIFAADDSWDEVDPQLEESEWCVVPVVARVSGPSSGVITVGRVRLYDVVLRYEAISKLHAQFIVGPQGVTHLRDLRSTHGTFVNGQRIPPDEQRPVLLRDRLSFGAVDLEWLDAETTRELLLAK